MVGTQATAKAIAQAVLFTLELLNIDINPACLTGEKRLFTVESVVKPCAWFSIDILLNITLMQTTNANNSALNTNFSICVFYPLYRTKIRFSL